MEFLRLFFSPLPPLPPPVKPSDNSGPDRLARNKEGARGEEGEFDSFFKSGTKYPPPFLPLSFLPPYVYLQLPNLSSRAQASLIWMKPHWAESRGPLTENWMDSMPSHWYPSTCLCPSLSPILSSVVDLPLSRMRQWPQCCNEGTKWEELKVTS